MVDRLKITSALGLHPYGTLWLETLHLIDWGRGLRFECVYEPGAPGAPAPFQLILRDCRDLRWRVYAHLAPSTDENAPPPRTDIVNISLGKSQHRQPASILTSHFGLTVWYGQLALHNGQVRLPLEGLE